MDFHQVFKKKYLGKVGLVVMVQEKSVRLLHEEAGGKMVWWAYAAVKMEQEAGDERESDGEVQTAFQEKYNEEEGGEN